MSRQRKKRDEADTPLGREYARLNSLSTDAPALDAFPGARAFRPDALVVWTASVGATRFPLSPDAIRPNPVVVGDLVLCSTFSPGTVVAFDRKTGAQRWSLPLAYYGSSLYHPSGSALVYGGTCQELLAV